MLQKVLKPRLMTGNHGSLYIDPVPFLVTDVQACERPLSSGAEKWV